MTPAPRRFVADASVAIQLFIAEPLSDRADALFRLVQADAEAQIHVPDLFYAECANILWKYVRRFAYPETDALRSIARLRAMALKPTANQDLMEDALRLAIRYDISAYDASYVALAHRLDIPLVTADERLVRTMRDKKPRLLWLGDPGMAQIASQ
jgi:predicted nucleic acid-binding protein